MKVRRFSIGLVSIALAGLIAGCAGTQQQVAKPKFYFPALPDEPRLEYITYFQNESDITIPSALDTFFGTEERGESLDSPVYIASNGKGLVYVVDLNKNGVTVWDSNKHEVRRLSGGYTVPRGIAVDKDGNVYVGDKEGKIFVYDGTSEAQIREIKVAEKVSNPLQISIDNVAKHLIVPSASTHKVVVFDLKGKFLFEFGKRGNQDGEFNYPVATAVDRKGRILVADSLNARVQRFTAEGEFIDVIGSRGDGLGHFQLVKGVATDSEGNIYATDGRHKRVLIFNDAGEFATMLGDGSSKPDGNSSPVYGTKSFVGAGGKLFIGAFALPQGVYVDQEDNVFIVDQLSHLFHQFKFLDANARQKVMAENKGLVDQLLAKIKAMEEGTTSADSK